MPARSMWRPLQGLQSLLSDQRVRMRSADRGERAADLWTADETQCVNDRGVQSESPARSVNVEDAGSVAPRTRPRPSPTMWTVHPSGLKAP